MMYHRKILLGLVLTFTAACPALAQDKFPNKPVTVVVPQAAGGANDAIARVIAQKLSEQMGQPFVIDNRTGAVGNVGTTAVARAKADGYTLMVNRSFPGKINIGYAGTLNHLIGEMLSKAAGIDMVHVPYKSTPEQFANLVRDDLSRWAKIVKTSGATID